ncbi:hypothetical protein GCM10022207_47210 [Streptomyces lannensis]|uniref:Uncharacterized protein n=1 Tax=Streptomyces lannensis TaxID=766498 RepID=A0ABP7KHH8_9ACTN
MPEARLRWNDTTAISRPTSLRTVPQWSAAHLWTLACSRSKGRAKAGTALHTRDGVGGG